jgi:NTP pyrophosphatase (non-canonical NTP hydrolase)
MVRIVKIEPHPSVVKEAVCRSCGATLEYVPKEVQTRTWMDYGGGNNVVEYESLFDISCNPKNTFPVLARNAKTMEELGEFSEALLHKLGHLPHKTMKEPIEGEAADVILCIIDTLAGAYPELKAYELALILEIQLRKKSQKWEKVMAIRNQNGTT